MGTILAMGPAGRRRREDKESILEAIRLRTKLRKGIGSYHARKLSIILV